MKEKEILRELSAAAQKISEANTQALSKIGTYIDFESLNKNMQALLRGHEEYRTEITEELRKVIASLSVIGEINVQFEEILSGIKSLNESIREYSDSGVGSSGLTDEQVKSIDDLKRSIDNLTKFASSLNGAITMDQGSIESTLNKTRYEMMKMIGSSSKEMEKEYKKNLENTFRVIADNLRAIINKLDNDMQNRNGNNEV